jgi:hypothetical protein
MEDACGDSNVHSSCLQAGEFLAVVSVIFSSALEISRMITEYKVSERSISKIYSPRTFILNLLIYIFF